MHQAQGGLRPRNRSPEPAAHFLGAAFSSLASLAAPALRFPAHSRAGSGSPRRAGSGRALLMAHQTGWLLWQNPTGLAEAALAVVLRGTSTGPPLTPWAGCHVSVLQLGACAWRW